MIKLIVLCAIITFSIARSLNDNLPSALINEGNIEAESDASNLTKPKAVAVDELAKDDREAESDTSNLTEAKTVAVEKLAKNDREAKSDTSNLTEPEAVAVEELANNNREAESDTSNLTEPKAVEESTNDNREADDFIILPVIPQNYDREADTSDLNEPNVVGGEQSPNESNLAAVVESNSMNITDDDQKRWLFKSTRAAGTTTPLPFTSIISLLLVVDSTAIGGG